MLKTCYDKIFFQSQLIGKKFHTYDIVGGLFGLTTRCNLMGVGDPVKEASYEQTPFKKIVSFLIYEILLKHQIVT
jgi:hypothetical protein